MSLALANGTLVAVMWAESLLCCAVWLCPVVQCFKIGRPTSGELMHLEPGPNNKQLDRTSEPVTSRNGCRKLTAWSRARWHPRSPKWHLSVYSWMRSTFMRILQFGRYFVMRYFCGSWGPTHCEMHQMPSQRRKLCTVSSMESSHSQRPRDRPQRCLYSLS